MTRLPLLLAVALTVPAGCDGQPATPTANATTNVPAPQPAFAPPPTPFSYTHKSELLDFRYKWPAEVSAIPDLTARFTREMKADQTRLTATARTDEAEREKSYPFQAYRSETAITTAGESPRLLSLRIDMSALTGGAHGNHGSSALLWDRKERREVTFASLFADRANRDRVLFQRWCDALATARASKRGSETSADNLFGDCPSLDEIAMIPVDEDRNGRFERLMLVASPYVAGPWVEGTYEIILPVTAAFVAVLKADYRPSFQPQ